VAYRYGDAREWLTRAIRCLERVQPLPYRALAFAQLQLSQVLTKEGHDGQALQVLDKAASFYLMKANEGVAKLQSNGMMKQSNSDTKSNQNEGADGDENIPIYLTIPNCDIFFPPVLVKGQQPYEDVRFATELCSRLVKMYTLSGNAYKATEYSEAIAELHELAYGYDSIEAANARKDVRIYQSVLTHLIID
jgi:hypothetical protein